MAKFRVNILSLGSLGHFGEPMDLFTGHAGCCHFCQEAPQLHVTPPPLHNLLCTRPEHRLCPIHTGIGFNICPVILTHTEARVSPHSLLHLKKYSLPSQASARLKRPQSLNCPPLPEAQATSFGTQLPGTRGISEQGAPPAPRTLPTGPFPGKPRTQSPGTLQPCRHPLLEWEAGTAEPAQLTRLNWNCLT